MGIKVIMYNIHTHDEVAATILATEHKGLMVSYLVSWFGTQETITNYQGWTIKKEL